MGQLKKLAGQTLIYGLGTIVPRLLNYLLLTPFYTRIFLPEKYGSITELYSYVAFFLMFLTYGMETTFFRYYLKSKRERNLVFNNIYSLLLVSTSVFFLLVVLLSKNLSSLFDYQYNYKIFLILAAIIATDVLMAVPFAKLRIQDRALKFSYVKIINVVSNIIFNVLFLIVLPNYYKKYPTSNFSFLFTENALFYYAFLSNLFANFVSFAFLLTDLKYFKFQWNWKIMKVCLAYGIPLLLVGFSGMINEVADKILMRWLLDPSKNKLYEIGIYGANFKLAVLLTIFVQMFKYASEPFFFANRTSKENKALFSSVMNWFVIFCLFIFLGITLFIDLAKYFIGPSYYEGLKIVPIILLANIFLGIYFNLSIWFKLGSKTYIGAYISFIGACITLIVNFILVPIYGYLGAAWAHFICYFVMMCINYFIGQKYYPVPYNLSKIFFYFGLSLSIFAVSKFFGTNFYFSVLLIGVFMSSVVIIEKVKIFNLIIKDA